MNQHLAAGTLRNMAREAVIEFRFAPLTHEYSRVINHDGTIMLEVDRQQRVMVAILTSQGEVVTSSFRKAVRILAA